jgi:hypothetical protein
VIQAYELTSARVADAAVTPSLDPPPWSVGVGDRGYYNPEMRRRLAEAGVTLLAPYYQKSRDPDPGRSSRLSSVRYRIETVAGQLAAREMIKRTWAKDLWHLCHRIIMNVFINMIMI